ncbi:MAG: hypothetical protein Q9209_006226 [Squamulea sp. 1 TL-2023]
MPETSKPPINRGRPSFKPPRPAANKSSKRKSRPTPRRKSAPITNTPSSTESNDEAISLAAEQTTDSENDHETSSATAAGPSGSQDPPPVVPPKLVTKLLYHHLEKHDGEAMKIGKEANKIVGKYFDTFVREAIARAAFERSQADEAAGTGDGFLEVWQHGTSKSWEGILTCDTGRGFGKDGATTVVRLLIYGTTSVRLR